MVDMKQSTMFDAFTEARYEAAGLTPPKRNEAEERDRAMAAAAAKNAQRLASARAVAVDHAKRHGTVDIDDVRCGLADEATLMRLGLPIEPFVPGNWMGSTFKEPGVWEVVGLTHTTHKKGHARRVLTYRLASR
jgi:hypothetical protein